MNKRFNALLILDGFGLAENDEVSAIAGNDPYICGLMKKYPHTQIGASGMDVGLPEGQMGNSEVGHLNIGAGRIVYQELTRITKAIDDGDFFSNPELTAACENAKNNGKNLHVLGLLSDGGVHSHIRHLFALIKLAKLTGLPNVYVHCFMDGRDVSPTSGADYIRQLQAYMSELNYGSIATVVGRYYAMDRDCRWDRVQAAYDAMVSGRGEAASSPVEAVEASYASGVTDEFIKPIVVNGAPRVSQGDSVIFFNFRPDRARELTRAFADPAFTGFPVKKGLDLKYVCMTQYDVTMSNVGVAFKPQSLKNTFGEYIADLGYTQLRIAETEKYAHVTFFFNGGVEKANPGEDRVLIPSPKVATYDLKPEMSAYEVADKAVELIKSRKYDVMVLNFANCDMVGHTGVMEAAQSAVRAVDACVKKVVEAIRSVNGACLVIADHGNADKMYEADGSPFTAHTTAPVPLILVDDERLTSKLRAGGRLADVTPTLLDMMGEQVPLEMTGESLIERS